MLKIQSVSFFIAEMVGASVGVVVYPSPTPALRKKFFGVPKPYPSPTKNFFDTQALPNEYVGGVPKPYLQLGVCGVYPSLTLLYYYSCFKIIVYS